MHLSPQQTLSSHCCLIRPDKGQSGLNAIQPTLRGLCSALSVHSLGAMLLCWSSSGPLPTSRVPPGSVLKLCGLVLTHSVAQYGRECVCAQASSSYAWGCACMLCVSSENPHATVTWRWSSTCTVDTAGAPDG